MKAGRNLDARVAEHVLGWVWWQWATRDGTTERGLFPPDTTPPDAKPWQGEDHPVWLGSVPHYSSSFDAAWTIVQHLRPRYAFLIADEHPKWDVEFHSREYANEERDGHTGPRFIGEATETHEAHAIALAALRAITHENGGPAHTP